MKTHWILGILLCAFFISTSLAQPTLTDPNFVLGSSTTNGNGAGLAGGNATCALELSDGKLLITGTFTSYNGFPSNRIARLLPSGGYDETFTIGSGANDAINHALQTPDGQVFIAGNFTSYNGTAAGRILKLQADGSVSTAFNPGTGANGAILKMALQTDGKLVIVGSFTTFNGINRNRIARLNEDGSLDISFDPGSGANETIQTCLINNSGNIYIGGYFTVYNDITTHWMAKLNPDGTLDASFQNPLEASSGFQSMALLEDEKLLLAYRTNGFLKPTVVKLNSDGSNDESFTVSENISLLTDIYPTANGQLIMAGSYSDEAQNYPYIFRLNQDGSLDESFLVQGRKFINASVINVTMLSSGKILSALNNTLIRLYENGFLDASFNRTPGPNGVINVSKLLPDGKILLAGSFNKFDGYPATVIRLLPTGKIDTTFFIVHNYSAFIESINIAPDGKVIVGGNTQYRVERFNTDGSRDQTFSFYGGASVFCTAVQADGKIIVGGYGNILRLNVNGSLDNTFNTGGMGIEGGSVYNIDILADQKILITGWFVSYNGISKTNIARLNADGTLDNTFNQGGSGLIDGNGVSATAILPDGKIMLCGSFLGYNGFLSSHVLRLYRDGRVDTTFKAGTGFLYNIEQYPQYFPVAAPIEHIIAQPDGKYIICGSIKSYQSSPQNNIIRVNADGSIDPTFLPQGAGLNNRVRTATYLADGKLLIGGDFTLYNGAPAIFVNMWQGDPVENYCEQVTLMFNDVSDIVCSTPGKATAFLNGAVAPFQYHWPTLSSSLSSVSISEGGIYPVTISDVNGCTKSSSILITAPVAPETDLSAGLHTTSFRPGVQSTLQLVGYNQGCTPSTGQLKIKLSSLVTFNAALPAPSAVVADTLIWDFEDLSPGVTFTPSIQVTTLIDAQMGDAACFHVSISGMPEIYEGNNVKEYCYPVVNSYDPNDKQAYPQGSCENHYITADQLLTYTVRFQNTGTAEAIDVLVTDTLSEGLDISTVRIISHSHPLVTEVEEQTLKFHFDNILLPPASEDDNGSNGYVVFEIAPVQDATNNLRIENKVNIYFDFNEPIITNTVFHTLTSAIPSVDVSVAQNDNVLTAQATGATYQWIYCSDLTEVSDATSASFALSGPGSYAVVVTQEGCKDTSLCYSETVTATIPWETENGITLAPNPGHDEIRLHSKYGLEGARVRMLNASGMIVKDLIAEQNALTWAVFDQPNGLYIIEIWQQGAPIRIKWIKN